MAVVLLRVKAERNAERGIPTHRYGNEGWEALISLFSTVSVRRTMPPCFKTKPLAPTACRNS